MRFFLAAWLAVFAVQAIDLVAALVPDSCSEATSGTPADPCDDACPRCLCCGRVPVYEPQAATIDLVESAVAMIVVPSLRPPTDPGPRGIYHVPKHS